MISGPRDLLGAKAQAEIDRMAKWECTWRIKINARKTKLVPFGKNPKKLLKALNKKPITLNNTPIPIVSSHTILGIHINSNLSFVPAIQKIRASVNKARISFLKFAFNLSHRTRTFLYKTYILPRISYHFPIHSFLSRHQQHKLQAIQNRCLLHFIYTWTHDGAISAHTAHNLTNLVPVNILHHKLAQTHHKRLRQQLPSWFDALCMWHATKPRPSGTVIKHCPNPITPVEWAVAPCPIPILIRRHPP